MAPRHLRHADAGLEALHHDAGLVLARPPTAPAGTRDQLDPPHIRDAATAHVRVAFKLTFKPNVKIIAHGSALRHNPDPTETWEGNTAYLVPGLQVLDAVAKRYRRDRQYGALLLLEQNPAFTFGTAVPFGLNTRQYISWLLWGAGQDMLNDLLKEYNCLGIPPGSTGAQMGGWFRKEIKSSEDLKGLIE